MNEKNLASVKIFLTGFRSKAFNKLRTALLQSILQTFDPLANRIKIFRHHNRRFGSEEKKLFSIFLSTLLTLLDNEMIFK